MLTTLKLVSLIWLCLFTSPLTSNILSNRHNDGNLPGLNQVDVSYSEGTSIVEYLPDRYVKDASVDYTEYIQTALDRHKHILIPSFPILINDRGLKIRSNSKIFFQRGAELRLLPSLKKTYAVLDISNVQNVIIKNPVIKGDRYTHIGTGGEWGMGIRILGSSNIIVENAHITDCWGDGIYIGQFQNKKNCTNILIKKAYLKKNRRDGISVISADGLLLQDIYAAYTDGTKPMTGINFEPNNPLCELKNIKVINPRTEQNGSRGIQIALKHFVGNSRKLSDITIINHVDIGSPDNAFKMSARPEANTDRLHGYIKIISPSWIRTQNNVPLNLSSNQSNYVTHISSAKVRDREGRTLSSTESYSLLVQQNSRARLRLTK